MRLRELKALLENAEPELTVTSKPANNGNYTVHGLQRAINKINELSFLGLFDSDIVRLKGLGDTVYYSRNEDDTVLLREATTNMAIDAITIAKEKLTGFSKAIDNSLPKSEMESVSVKLPNYDQIEDIGKFFKKLDTAFHTSLTIDEVKGNYKVINFDSGSLWVEVLITTIQTASIDKLVAMQMIGGIIKHSMDFYKQHLDIQIARRKLEELRLGNEAIQPSLDALDEQIDKLLEDKIEKIYATGNYSEESKTSIKKSVKTFSELIEEGTEFYPSIEAPPEIVKLFPEESRKLSNPQKLISDQSDSGVDIVEAKKEEQ